MKTRTLELHCQLGCGTVCGTVRLPVEAPDITEDEYRERGKIVDQRCSECDANHGTFRELLDTYQKETGENEAKAEDFAKRNRKRQDFETELVKYKKEKDIKNTDIID